MKPFLAILFCLLLQTVAPASGAGQPSKPNLILIMADDKYEQSAGEAQIPADSAGFLGKLVVFQITAN